MEELDRKESLQDSPETPAEKTEVKESSKETSEVKETETTETQEKPESPETTEVAEKETEQPVAEKEPATKEEIVEALKTILNGEGKDISREDVNKLKQAFFALRRDEIESEKKAHLDNGGTEEDFLPQVDDKEQEVLIIIGELRQKKAEWIEIREKHQKENLEKKESIIAAIQSLAQDTDNVNRQYSRFKELAQQFRELGEVPPENITLIWKQFQDAEQLFYDQLKINQELRDYDFKKNLEVKQSLVEKAEALASNFSDKVAEVEAEAKQDIVAAFKTLQDLHDQWKQTGPVAKELREDLWQKFREATVVINKEYQSFFEKRKANAKANETAKEELCKKVESIDYDSIKTVKEWEKATEEVIAAQNDWKKIGFASRKVNNALYAKFRMSCDDFFKRKGEFFSTLKATQAENLEKKTALAVRAEELQDSTDWNATAAELTKLQNQWKKIGAIPRKQSDALWERFHNACDKFFNARKEVLGNTRNEERANLKAKEEILVQLNELLNAETEEEVKTKLAELQKKWKEIGFVPFRDKNRIADSYRDIINKIRKAFNIAENRASLEKFQSSLDDIKDSSKLEREREKLFRALENKRSDLINYQNNMGFLTSKSKSGDGLLKEIEKKVELIKGDIADLEQRISLIDSKLA